MDKITHIWIRKIHDLAYLVVPWWFMFKFWYRKWWKRFFIIFMNSISAPIDMLRIIAYRLTGISKVYEFLVFLTVLFEPGIYVAPDIKYNDQNMIKMMTQYFKTLRKLKRSSSFS